MRALHRFTKTNETPRCKYGGETDKDKTYVNLAEGASGNVWFRAPLTIVLFKTLRNCSINGMAFAIIHH